MLESRRTSPEASESTAKLARASVKDQRIVQSPDAQAVRLQNGLGGLTHAIVEGLEQQLLPYQIDAVEYTILGICLAAGSITIRDLRSKVPIDYAHLSRTVSRLEDKDLVEKLRLEPDRRVVSVRVTAKGQALMPELMRSALNFYEALVKDITQEELGSCMAVMERLSSLGDAADPGAPA